MLSCVTLFFAASYPGHVAAGGDGFLFPQHRSQATVEDFRVAMSTVMGCGGGTASERLRLVEEAILPMWHVLPKNKYGLVEWRIVRYLAHRYFTQQSSLHVKGFEPMRQLNSSYLGSADILSTKVPSLIDSAFESKRSSDGFSLEEAVTMVGTLEQLMSDAESTLLEAVYTHQRRSPKQLLNHVELSDLIEVYVVHWMMYGDTDLIRAVLRNRLLLHKAIPKWSEIKAFVDGLVKSMEFSRQRTAKTGHGLAALAGQYSFEDAHEVVRSITKEFASFWESECQLIKESLLALDKTGTGRVSLSDFYGANADGEWRFGESETYLRELGALDESSAWRGKQVIIPNYLQSASNCIVAAPHYFVCCVNECESVLKEIEDKIGAPVAQPEQLLPLVGNMTNLEDEQPKIDATLRSQLHRIAETHGGQVPLHGRLFAQWLHYVFPRECPFPHKVGTASALAPLQFGANYRASDTAIQTHAATRNGTSEMLASREETQWMSQWSEEEELISDYSLHLRAPWESSRQIVFGGFGFFALIMIAGGVASGSRAKPIGLANPFAQKSHIV